MTRRVIISRRALKDLDQIWTYINGRAGPNVASDFVAEILAAVDQLAEMPGMGHARRDVSSRRYRFWSVKSYVVAYRPTARTLRLVRVVHGSRDFGRLFRG